MKHLRIAVLFIASSLLAGCATEEKRFDNANRPHSLYIVVERNSRLPADFLTVLKQESQKRLPETNIVVDENGVDDQTLATAEWVVALRATRITPDYSFKPSGDSTLNGIVDCLAGSAIGAGVILFPCEYSTDIDFLEASVRNSNGKTLKTYTAQQDGEGWMWPLPYTAIELWLSGMDNQHQVWLNLINTLYDKMLAEDVFSS